MNQTYQEFRNLYSRQQGVIHQSTLRELENLSNRIENDELRDAVYQLLTLEALAAQGYSEILDLRPTIIEDNPNSDTGLPLYYRDAALNWMANHCNHYQDLQNDLIEILLPSIQEVRELLPQNEDDELVLEEVFDCSIQLSDYVEELMSIVQERQQSEQIWDSAYQLLGRIQPEEVMDSRPLKLAFIPSLIPAVLRNRNFNKSRAYAEQPRLSFIPQLTLAVLRTRYMCRFTGK